MSLILSLCHPATFGVGGQSVLDFSYRACYQLPPDQFWTSFAPEQFQMNIVHEITRLLFPPATVASSSSLRAELYKLNIYSTGGMFKAHRDTPRAMNMVGSLVVCLPFPHQGGALVVRHGKREVTYDWSFELNDSNSIHQRRQKQIQWAAFFGDCEHEILPVTSGHRVTLTYNLYSEEVPQLTAAVSSADTDTDTRFLSNPFLSLLFLLLRSPTFLSGGGRLGVHCRHGYAHTSKAMQSMLTPRLLKGGDAMLYDGIRQLGLRCDFVPVVNGSYVLNEFCRTDTSRHYADEDGEDDGDEVMGVAPSRDIIWLNQGGVEELQEAHAAYGNEATMDTMYSKVAIIIHVTSWDEETKSRALPATTATTATIPTALILSAHPHTLQHRTRPAHNSRWICDVCRCNGKGKSWICCMCNWDMCDSCYQKATASASPLP